MPMKLRIGRRTGFVIPGPADSEDHRTAGGTMYVRMTTLSFRVDKADEGSDLRRERSAAARAQKGYRGAPTLLADRSRLRRPDLLGRRGLGSGQRREPLLSGTAGRFIPLFTSPPVREGFEVVVESH
jgi:hypothetical protein